MNCLARLFGVLGTLPTVQCGFVAVVTLDFLTLFWGVGLSFIKNQTDANAVFNGWLYVLPILNGAHVTAFGLKRFSDSDYAAAKVSGKNPATDRNAMPTTDHHETEESHGDGSLGR